MLTVTPRVSPIIGGRLGKQTCSPLHHASLPMPAVPSLSSYVTWPSYLSSLPMSAVHCLPMLPGHLTCHHFPCPLHTVFLCYLAILLVITSHVRCTLSSYVTWPSYLSSLPMPAVHCLPVTWPSYLSSLSMLTVPSLSVWPPRWPSG